MSQEHERTAQEVQLDKDTARWVQHRRAYPTLAKSATATQRETMHTRYLREGVSDDNFNAFCKRVSA